MTKAKNVHKAIRLTEEELKIVNDLSIKERRPLAVTMAILLSEALIARGLIKG